MIKETTNPPSSVPFFSLITQDAVTQQLSHCLTLYNQDPSCYKANNELLQKSLEQLLTLPPEALKQPEALRLQSLGQVMGLYGKGSKTPFPETNIFHYVEQGKLVIK